MSRVFLTGGSGLVGGALATRLVQRGDEVVALARSDTAEQALAERGAQVVRGDALDEDTLATGMAGCELVYHVAGINTLCPTDPAALIHVNVRGVEAAVRAAGRAGARRVVLTSSAATDVFRSSDDRVGDVQRSTRQETSMTVQPQPQCDEDPVPTAQEKAQEKDKENERAAEEMRVLEQGDPPANLDDWPDGPAKYLTYGSSEDEPYGTGVTAKLGPADLERHSDGSIVIDGHTVDNPEDYKAKPPENSASHPDATNS